jgi:cold shock CspA family protein
MNGTMLWFNPAKGHGYIRTNDGERLLLKAEGVSPGHVLGDRCAGTEVTFDRVEAAAGPHAVAVEIVPVVAPRRARRRRR